MGDFEKALQTLLSDAMERGVPPLSLCETMAQATASMLRVCREQAEAQAEDDKSASQEPALILPERYRR